MIGNNQLRAELFVADSVRQALTTLAERLPDLILVSPLLLPRDLAALDERLRELEKDGFKVPTLTIPLLEASSQRTVPHAPQKGAPNRSRVTRGPRGNAETCDPTTFGLQIAAALERTLNERPAAVAAFRPKPSNVQPIDVQAVEFTDMDETEETAAASDGPEWRDVLSALRRDLHHTKAERSEPAVPAAPAPRPAPARLAHAHAPSDGQQPIVIRAAAPTAAIERRPAVRAEQPAATERSQPVAVKAPADAAAGPAAAPAATEANGDVPLKKKRAKIPPAQDEWGMFDPQQCGLAALRVKLSELAEGRGDQKKPA
jgi:hypothetical protein